MGAIANSLLGREVVHPKVNARPVFNGKTQLLRWALDQGAFTALELKNMVDLADSSLVYSLLKNDIKKGTVTLTNGVITKVK